MADRYEEFPDSKDEGKDISDDRAKNGSGVTAYLEKLEQEQKMRIQQQKQVNDSTISTMGSYRPLVVFL